ncbi:MAG: DUF6516 family protein, partial [Thermodesulfobacteriota bacterium]|nr:DUF6516 family protein [Thermodesulfobacteriota bacterium]
MKYSFHWQNAQGRLRQRWDNAPHYPDLPNAPHHVHGENDSVQEVMQGKKEPKVAKETGCNNLMILTWDFEAFGTYI